MTMDAQRDVICLNPSLSGLPNPLHSCSHRQAMGHDIDSYPMHRLGWIPVFAIATPAPPATEQRAHDAVPVPDIPAPRDGAPREQREAQQPAGPQARVRGCTGSQRAHPTLPFPDRQRYPPYVPFPFSDTSGAALTAILR